MVVGGFALSSASILGCVGVGFCPWIEGCLRSQPAAYDFAQAVAKACPVLRIECSEVPNSTEIGIEMRRREAIALLPMTQMRKLGLREGTCSQVTQWVRGSPRSSGWPLPYVEEGPSWLWGPSRAKRGCSEGASPVPFPLDRTASSTQEVGSCVGSPLP